MAAVCLSCVKEYENSPFVISHKVGFGLRITLLVAAIIGACVLARLGYNKGLCIGIGCAPIPLFFIDLVIKCCESSIRDRQRKKEYPTELFSAVSHGTVKDVEAALKKNLDFEAPWDEHDGETAIQRAVYSSDGPKKILKMIESGKVRLDPKGSSSSLLESVLYQSEDEPGFREVILVLAKNESACVAIRKSYKLVHLLNFLKKEDHTNQALNFVENFVIAQTKFDTSTLINDAHTFYGKEPEFLDYFFNLLTIRADFQVAACERLGKLVNDKNFRDAIFKYLNFEIIPSLKIAKMLIDCLHKTDMKTIGLILDQINVEQLNKVLNCYNDQEFVSELKSEIGKRLVT